MNSKTYRDKLVDKIVATLSDGGQVESGFLDETRRIILRTYSPGIMNREWALTGLDQLIKLVRLAGMLHTNAVHAISDVSQTNLDMTVAMELQNNPLYKELLELPNLGIQILVPKSESESGTAVAITKYNQIADEDNYDKTTNRYSRQAILVESVDVAIPYLNQHIEAENLRNQTLL